MEVNGERLEPFKPPFSVLELIRNTVAPEELPVIHSYLGESTIEYCKDLRNEMETLLEIWRDIGDRTEMPTVSKPLSNPLPDPPIMREMLKKEIQILVKGVQDRHTVSGDQTLNENIFENNFILHFSYFSERPSTPIRHYTSETSYTTSPVKLKHVRSNINVKDIDKVALILKEAIQKECAALEHDIEFLQKCVEEEHDLVASPPATPMQEPSLNKLREVRKLLENQV
uniref:Coiled-coil domain-containing protein 24 n=1 Tax=Ciona intestinalis TaxID=7719 RepID=F7BM33_CIOIN